MKVLLAASLLLVSALPARAVEGDYWRWQFGTRQEMGSARRVPQTGGAVSANSQEYSARRRVALSENLLATVGLGYERVELRPSAQVPLPDQLQALSGRLGAEWLLDRRSWVFVDASPGLYGENLEGRAFNAPVSAQYNRMLSPGLRALGGLSFDSFRKSKLLPFGGVAWRLTPRWNLRLLLPEPRVEYRMLWDERQTVDLFAGASIVGGQYRVAKDLGIRRGLSWIGGQTLSYSQTRLLGGMRWMRGDLELEFSGGWAATRRFRYEPGGGELSSDKAIFTGLSLTARL
jgi:hypothetical protein